MKEKTKVKINCAQTIYPEAVKGQAKKKWRKPKLEDVSGKVMAQPYIRFT